MPRALFITGTGTDVGKTALSLAVLLWARNRGLRIAYLKPVQCGTSAMGMPPVQGGDADWIRARSWTGQSLTDRSSTGPAGTDAPGIRAHVTYQLPLAASPHLASEREGIRIDTGRIRREAESLRDGSDLLIMEGAGGAAVPLDRQGSSLASLAAAMGMPALIAGEPGLGTLHHTLATVAYLRSLSAPIAGFAFCHKTEGEVELREDNRATLAALTGLPFFGALPYSASVAAGQDLGPEGLRAWLAPVTPALEAWWKGT